MLLRAWHDSRARLGGPVFIAEVALALVHSVHVSMRVRHTHECTSATLVPQQDFKMMHISGRCSSKTMATEDVSL
jgi:hypothetical protein